MLDRFSLGKEQAHLFVIPDPHLYSATAWKVDAVSWVVRQKSPLHAMAESFVENGCMISYGRVAQAA